jgi:hypothetical protein
VTLRRRTGLPHKILLDEAHYFLGAPGAAGMIDPDLAGYILVTYRVSSLDPAIRMTSDAVVMVTHESDQDEAKALLEMCRPCAGAAVSASVFEDLQMSEAALLPGAEEAHGVVRRFQLAPRLTGHVRHSAKYLYMPVTDDKAFVFTGNGHAGPRARTLKEFMGFLTTLPAPRVNGHIRRHDFSRWLQDVFRDNPLASRVSAIEERVDAEDARDIVDAVIQTIRARYDTAADAG